jgi:N-acetylglucosaminyldiphosphoundecaprenol N-acetyl-beta-D-mannosaminyltransferase
VQYVEAPDQVQRIRVVGVPVDVVPPDRLESVVERLLADPGQDQLVFLRLEDLMRARRNQEFRRLVQGARLVVPTTAGIIRGARFLGLAEPARYEPFNFVIRLLGILEKKAASLYIFGLGRRHLLQVEQNLRETFPGLRLVGRYPGYYPRGLEGDIITAIKKASPSMLLVGPGVPRGERWIMRNKASLNNGLYLAAAEVLDIFADRRTRRTPGGLAGFFRTLGYLATHPWRILRVFMYLWYGILLVVYRIFNIR